VRTTYKHLMDMILQPMLGRNVQAYVDDMAMTLEQPETHLADLEELFKRIGKHHLKLNPEKCVFGVRASW